MNVNGLNAQLEYQESPGVFRTTKLDQINVNAFGTPDPGWYVQIPGKSNWTGPFDPFKFLGTDGHEWQANIHATYDGSNTFTTSFDVSWPDGSFPNHLIQIVDWQGNKWQIDELVVRGTGNPYNVFFSIKQI